MINNPNRGPFDRMKKGAERYANRKRELAKEQALEGTGRVSRRANRLKNSGNWASRRLGGALGGMTSANQYLAQRRVDREKQDEFAKAGADAAARNYVAGRAAPPAYMADPGPGATQGEKSAYEAYKTQEAAANAYATKIANGNDKLGDLAQSYALQSVQEEYEKDVKAAYVKEQQARRTKEDLHTRTMDSSLSVHERAAAMRRFKEVANAKSTQEMVESIADLGATAEASGDADQMAKAQKMQQEFIHAFAGSSLMPKSVSGTDKGDMENGRFKMKRDARIKRDLQGSGKGSKVNADYILSMDVDEMDEWASDASAISTLQSLDPAAKKGFIDAMTEAANDDINGTKFENRQVVQMKKIASILGGSVTIKNPKFKEKWK